MILPFTQVDAFVVDGKPLTGNPAAVMVLEDWLPDRMLQAIAIENNLSETAFLKRSGGEADWDLRWFTPGCEVDMCGHATIASGHALIGDADRVTFASRAGLLAVERSPDGLRLDLPAATGMETVEDDGIIEALRVLPRAVLRAKGAEDTLFVLLDDEAAVRACAPDFAALAPYEEMVVVTAPGETADIASRVFAVAFGIDEDPVTGSAHAAIAPWWAEQLGTTHFTALQASARGGQLACEVADHRVCLTGRCVTVIEGAFRL
ncbi:PhzF family phenazine biosynthesis protein [Sphingomicrobium sp. XHP0235]|uniref:PhzF family phenazine biosynthesis protein n=1 Tax=Sphingomicrobium aquimarinum TaxID=3133971 RepID=UPI0031FF3C9D